MAHQRAFGAALAFALIAAAPAHAQTPPKPPGFACGGSPPQMITVAPIPKFTVIDFDNRGADCAMWQTFFYLNWPVLANQRGMPNPNYRRVINAPGRRFLVGTSTGLQAWLNASVMF